MTQQTTQHQPRTERALVARLLPSFGQQNGADMGRERATFRVVQDISRPARSTSASLLGSPVGAAFAKIACLLSRATRRQLHWTGETTSADGRSSETGERNGWSTDKRRGISRNV